MEFVGVGWFAVCTLTRCDVVCLTNYAHPRISCCCNESAAGNVIVIPPSVCDIFLKSTCTRFAECVQDKLRFLDIIRTDAAALDNCHIFEKCVERL